MSLNANWILDNDGIIGDATGERGANDGEKRSARMIAEETR